MKKPTVGDHAEKGGRARAKKLAPEQRRAIAIAAAESRWQREGKDPLPRAAFGSDDRPLRIGDIEIPCYVLEDGRRVLSQRGLQTGLGMSISGGSAGRGGGEHRMARFVMSLAAKGLPVEELLTRIIKPILFRIPGISAPAYGYEATIITDLCDAILAARKIGALQKQQLHIADRCEILVRGFSRVGIIALVDEATGYQEVRAREALAEILEAFIAKELRKWVKTFPTEFYKEMFRLRGWDFQPANMKRPSVVGHMTNDVVYARLAPFVLEELKRVTPRNEKGRLKHHLHRRLTEDVGHPKLREHLASVIVLMRVSKTWPDFVSKLDVALPKFGDTYRMPFGTSSEGGGEDE